VDVLGFNILLFGVVVIFRDGSNKGTAIEFCANLRKSATETLAMIRQAFGKESVSHTESPNSSRPRKATQVKSKVKSMLIIFSDVRGVVHKKVVLQAKQSIPSTTVTFYCDCLKMYKDFTLNFGDERTGCCITTVHHRLSLPFFTREFRPKKHDCRPPPTLLFSVSPIEYKTERPPF
jgi:hypothetical protein